MKFYFTLFLILSSVFIGLCCFVSQNSTAQKTAASFNSFLPETQTSPQATPSAQKLTETSGWRTYRDTGGRYEFKYPPNFKVEQNGGSVRLFHQIKFKHQSPCQPQINADGNEDEYEGKKLEYLVDFDISFRIIDGGIKEAYIADGYDKDYAAKIADWLTREYEKVEVLKPDQRLNIKTLKFYSGDTPSSCGSYVYGIPLVPQKTLLVKRVFITLLNVSATYYLDVPVAEEYTKRLKKKKDLIAPEREEQIFYTVLSTWQKLK